MGEPTSAEMATMSYMQRVGTDTGSDGSSSILSHSFKKKTATPHLRILYFDNLRVIGWQVVSLGSEGRRQVVPGAFGGIRLHLPARQRPLPGHDRGRMPRREPRQPPSQNLFAP